MNMVNLSFISFWYSFIWGVTANNNQKIMQTTIILGFQIVFFIDNSRKGG